MLLAITSLGLIAAVIYSAYFTGSVSPSTVTGKLNDRIDNGYRFRDITYTDKIDLSHPDVKNNQFYYQGSFAADRGNNGVPRQYSQLYPGVSEITQYTLRDHLFL